MSTLTLPPVVRGTEGKPSGLNQPEGDHVILHLASRDECVVNPTSGARGAIVGVALGALLWLGLVLAGAYLMR